MKSLKNGTFMINASKVFYLERKCPENRIGSLGRFVRLIISHSSMLEKSDLKSFRFTCVELRLKSLTKITISLKNRQFPLYPRFANWNC